MRSVAATTRVICSMAVLSAMGWASPAHGQFSVPSTWLRTDAQGKGITLMVAACCSGGLRLVFQIPPMAGQAAASLTIDSPMDGTEVPVLVGGKASGETMAVTRLDDRRYSAVTKMGGRPFGTSTGTVAPDGKTMTVESVTQTPAGKAEKVIETWVRK
jgi:hypothetical protein